jgi:hypothetical protein
MQATLSPYPPGADWCSAHPAATEFIITLGTAINTRRDVSFRIDIVPGLVANAHRFGLLRSDRAYAVDHNLIPDIQRHIEWAHGVTFTKRLSKSDPHGVPNATPLIG